MIRALLAIVLVLTSCRPLLAAPVEVTTPELRGAVQPQLAVAPSGRIHVVFGKDNIIYHTASEDGRKFSTPVKVGVLEKLALKMRRGPRVTATDGVVLVTAISHADGNFHAWTSTDAGKTFRETEPVNSVLKSAREGLHAVAGDGRGKVAAVWIDDRTGAMQLWGRFSKDGGVTWGEEKNVYSAPHGPICPCCHPSVSFAPSGEVAIMWRNSLAGSRDMHFSTTSDDGQTFSPARKLGEGTWKIDGCPMDGGGIAADPEGNWITVWRRETQLFESEVGGPEQRFGFGRQPVIGFAGKDRVVVWEQNGPLMLKRGDEKPLQLAAPGASAAIVGGADSAIVAWEAGIGGADGLFVTRILARR